MFAVFAPILLSILVVRVRTVQLRGLVIDDQQDVITASTFDNYGEKMDDNSYSAPAVSGRSWLFERLGPGGEGVLYGREAIRKQYAVRLYYPLRRGILVDVYRHSWEDLLKLWQLATRHVGYECDYHESEEPVPLILVVSARETAANLIKYAENFILDCDRHPLIIQNHASMSAYARGLGTALVVHLGEFVSTVTPVVNGRPVLDRIATLEFGASYLTRSIVRHLGKDFRNMASFNYRFTIAEDIRKKTCFVSLNYEEDSTKDESEFLFHYKGELRGFETTLGKLRFQIGEEWFKVHGSYPTIDSLVAESLAELDAVFQRNVLLTGVGSEMPGLGKRLQEELFNSGFADVRVMSHDEGPERSSFEGALKYAWSKDSDPYWVTREEYEKDGLEVFKKKWNWFKYQ